MEEGSTEATFKLEQLFRTCDTKGTGYIGHEEFRELCAGLGIGTTDSDILFDDLDHDGNGRIDFDDFVQGFRDYVAEPGRIKSSSSARTTSEVDKVSMSVDLDAHYVGSLSSPPGARRKNSRRMKGKQQQTNDTWKTMLENIMQTSSKNISASKLQELQEVLASLSQSPQLASCFESIVQSLLQDMERLQGDNERLEEIYRTEKVKHDQHLRQIEDEIDAHVQKVEEKLKEQMREEAEAEIKALKAKMDAEMSELHSHLKIFQTFDSLLKKDRKDDDRASVLNDRLEEATYENRKLRMTLTDTQTNIALMHNELAHLRSQYEDKCKELHSERENSLHYLHEQDHFIRQLQLLQSANKRLQDANDCIRDVMETNVLTRNMAELNDNEANNNNKNYSQLHKKPLIGPLGKTLGAKRGSVIGDYLRDDLAAISTANCQQQQQTLSSKEILDMKLPEADSCYASLTDPFKVLQSSGCRPEELTFGLKRFMDDLDSGLSTSRDLLDLEEQDASRNASSNKMRRTSSSTINSVAKRELDMEVINLQGDDVDSRASDWAVLPVQAVSTSRQSRHSNLFRSMSRQSLTGRSSQLPKVSPFQANGVTTTTTTTTNNNNNNYLGFSCDDVRNCYEATGPPDRMYKVVFAGDAAVGKTTFIVRISKGFFVSTLTSTLGVDFHVKTFRVDEKNVSVQLWDTAGQERFRSVTKSYFRRADGVMLLYDCTSEHSFLSVRDWMEAIDEVSEKRIPIMLCANKIDLRETALLQGKSIVRTEDGERLARDFSAIFIEASAKTGKNVVDSLIQLTREMATNEDLEVQISGLKVTELAPTWKSNTCCSRK